MSLGNRKLFKVLLASVTAGASVFVGKGGVFGLEARDLNYYYRVSL